MLIIVCRLGGGPRDALDIMEHTFFADMDWEALYHKRIEPPFKPDVSDATDTKYFDKVRETRSLG